MLAIRRTTQFKKDVKLARKRGRDIGKLKEVLERLVLGESLEVKYRDHALTGDLEGTRDCHIEPDWLLIYQLTPDELILIRTGTHADLFRK
ncbi:MAG TPA: type II toxin-antitoxin system YafQ family toxin [Rhodothermales bacterium]|nr:type II toxin-antitoxin system YafQ family toxin [Rhodothermales bacterium]